MKLEDFRERKLTKMALIPLFLFWEKIQIKRLIVNRRTKLLYFWVLNKRVVNVNFIEMLTTIFNFTCNIRALKFIDKIDTAQGLLYKIKFKNISRPLYFPKCFNLHNLYQCTCEIFYLSEWHCYEALDKTKVTREDIVVDCGAAEGLFTLSILGRVKKVYSIEPIPMFIESMKETFKNISIIEILPVALGNKKGEAFLNLNGIASSISFNNNSGIKVNIVTLDSLFYDKDIPITYIKADIEGFELVMLEGGVKTIRKYLPKIVITTYHVKDHYKVIRDFLHKIDTRYTIVLRGVEEKHGNPVMLYAWIE